MNTISSTGFTKLLDMLEQETKNPNTDISVFARLRVLIRIVDAIEPEASPRVPKGRYEVPANIGNLLDYASGVARSGQTPKAFANMDPERVATFNAATVDACREIREVLDLRSEKLSA